MKNFLVLIVAIVLGSLPCFSAGGTLVTYTIDPVKNAYDHNNKGVNCVEEKDYYCAIQEFKIAISLNPKTQATAVYFNNLGKVYMTIGYPNLALDCFENSIIQYSLNFEYYQNLVKCYKALGMIDSKLKAFKTTESKNPLDKIILGLLYEYSGNTKKAIITFDDFVMSEPSLLITPAVKYHIQALVNEIS
jgi:tetratricopeptide (TPR) repeat protein